MISENDPDLVLITETWCNPTVSNAQLNIKGYFIDPELRSDRCDTANGIGGGLIVYCRDGLNIIPVDNDSIFTQFKQFVVKSKIKNTANLNFTLIYRSPNSTNDNTELLCDIIANHPSNSLIIGDFNLPNIDWNSHKCDNKSAKLVDTVDRKFLSQLITFPTHQKGNILDLAFTDIPDRILNIETVGNLGSSDHSIIRIDLQFSNNFNDTCQRIPDWNNADVDGFNDYLCNFDWNNAMYNMDTDQAWTYFREKINEGMHLFVPHKERRKRNRPCWVKRNVSKLSRKKQKLWKVYLKYPNNENFCNYKKAEKEFKRAVRNAKRDYEKKLSKTENLKCFNAYIKSKVKNNVPVGPLKVDNTFVADNIEIANVLNKYFCSVFTEEDCSQVPVIDDVPCDTVLSNINFSAEDIVKKIDNIKPGSAAGPDNISAMFLKKFKGPISLPLCLIFEKSMESGLVPEEWRSANITPIFKSGSKSECSNYRPVSLTSICCKIMESLIKDIVMDHLLLNNLIRSSQHGFLKNRSCLTNLLEFFEYVTNNIDNGSAVDAIYLDFSKAFDKVPHRRLISKFKSHKIDGNILNWLKNWLSGRKQRVVINGEHSAWEAVKSGVPQGSVLGPLAFIVFINDIDFCTTMIDIVNKFADDTKLGHKINCDFDRNNLQICLDNLCVWASKWGMQFNEKKCKVIHFGRNNPKFDYSMNGIKLKEVHSEKDVGVNIHSSLKPSVHCEIIANKANALLGRLTKSFHYRDRVTFVNLYKTYVRCHLEYCTPAWNPWTAADISVLEKVQERAVGMVSGLRSTSYSDRLRELGLLSLEDRRERFDMIQTYKFLNSVDNVDSTIWFQTVDSDRQNPTRLTSCPVNLVPKRSNLDIRKNFFSQRIVNKWNNLPSDVKTSPSLNAFKSRYDKLHVS